MATFDPHEIVDPHKTDAAEHIALDVWDGFLAKHPDVDWPVSNHALNLAAYWLRLRAQEGAGLSRQGGPAASKPQAKTGDG